MELQVLEPTAAPGRMWTDRLQLDRMEEGPSLGSYSSGLKSWRQLGFRAHSEFHLWDILTVGSLAPVIGTILVQKYTRLLIRGWRPAKLTACWPQTTQSVEQLLKPVLKGKILGLTKKNLSNLSPQGGEI